MDQKLQAFLIFYPVFLFSLTLHEAAHGWVALRLGDPTAKLSGRLTLNPWPHLDMIGTVLLPLLFIFIGGIPFAWAKPVPVDHRNLRNPRDISWVALAGPMSNFLLAFFFAGMLGIVFHLRVSSSPGVILYLMEAAKLGIYLNLILSFFNLIPLPPLDGAQILSRFLSPRALSFFERQVAPYGMIILLALILTGVFQFLSIPAYRVGDFFVSLFV